MNDKKSCMVRLAILISLLLSTCGLAKDAVLKVSSINWPDRYEEKLYNPDFYRTANISEIQELIAGKPLQDESNTYTKKEFARDHEMFGLNNLFSPVIPNSYVAEIKTIVRPVDIARQYSPHPDVIRIIEAASGITKEESLAYRLLNDKSKDIETILVEYGTVGFSCATCSILVSKKEVAALETYLRQYPGADINCQPQAVYTRAGRYQELDTPLVAEIATNTPTILQILLKN